MHVYDTFEIIAGFVSHQKQEKKLHKDLLNSAASQPSAVI